MLDTLEKWLFGGRTGRAGFRGAFLVLLVAFMIAAKVLGASIDPKNIVVTPRQSVPPALIGLLGLVIFVRAAGRRAHDLGLSGLLAVASILFIDIVSRASVGNDQITVTLNPVIVLLYYAAGINDWPQPIEWLRTAFIFNLSLEGSTVRLSGLIFPLVLALGLVKGRGGANAFGEGATPVVPKRAVSAPPVASSQ
jgi:uncharacterized membrane protein YhaH (DUF805 family)